MEIRIVFTMEFHSGTLNDALYSAKDNPLSLLLIHLIYHYYISHSIVLLSSIFLI